MFLLLDLRWDASLQGEHHRCKEEEQGCCLHHIYREPGAQCLPSGRQCLAPFPLRQLHAPSHCREGCVLSHWDNKCRGHAGPAAVQSGTDRSLRMPCGLCLHERNKDYRKVPCAIDVRCVGEAVVERCMPIYIYVYPALRLAASASARERRRTPARPVG